VPDEFAEGPSPQGYDRRALVKKLAVGAFAAPVIASFSLDSIARAGTYKGKKHDPHGKQAHPNQACGNQAHGNQTHGNQTHPNQTKPPHDHKHKDKDPKHDKHDKHDKSKKHEKHEKHAKHVKSKKHHDKPARKHRRRPS
jgi:hypothetical protein